MRALAAIVGLILAVAIGGLLAWGLSDLLRVTLDMTRRDGQILLFVSWAVLGSLLMGGVRAGIRKIWA